MELDWSKEVSQFRPRVTRTVLVLVRASTATFKTNPYTSTQYTKLKYA